MAFRGQSPDQRGHVWTSQTALDQQTLRGAGDNMFRIYVDINGDLFGQFENNSPKKIAGLGPANEVDTGVPIGAIFQWATSTPPLGYLLCDGSSVDSGQYPLLSAILTTTGGKTPDMSGRVPVGAGQPGYNDNWPGPLTVGSVGGSTEVHLSSEQLPEHSHTIPEEAATSSTAAHTHTVTLPEHGHLFEGAVPSHTHTIDFETSDPFDSADNEQGDMPLDTTDPIDSATNASITLETSSDDMSGEPFFDAWYHTAVDTVGSPFDGYADAYMMHGGIANTGTGPSFDVIPAHSHDIPNHYHNVAGHFHKVEGIESGGLDSDSADSDDGGLEVNGVVGIKSFLPGQDSDSHTVESSSESITQGTGAHSHGGATGITGHSQPDPVTAVQPYIAIYFIIKHD